MKDNYNNIRLLALTTVFAFSLCAPCIFPDTGYGVAFAQVRVSDVSITESGNKSQTKDEGKAVEDDSSGFVLLTDIVPDVLLEIRYFSSFNFVGRRVDGYEEPVALITKEAAAALKTVSDKMMKQGYRLKIFDIYRPQMAVSHFERWAKDLGDTLTKPYFYPELDKSVLFDLGFICHRSGHSRGSTVDLTLFDMKLGRDVDMGGPFDYFGDLSHPDYNGITDDQKANRQFLHDSMVEAGFVGIKEEWWHFTLKDEPYPETYFTFPSSASSVGKQQ